MIAGFFGRRVFAYGALDDPNGGRRIHEWPMAGHQHRPLPIGPIDPEALYDIVGGRR